MDPVLTAPASDTQVTPAPQKALKVALIGATALTVVYAVMVVGQRGTLDIVGLALAWATYTIVLFILATVAIVGWRALRS